MDYSALAPGVYVEESPSAAPIVGVGTSTAVFIGAWADAASPAPAVAAAGEIVECTNFTDFKLRFGAFASDTPSRNTLGLALRGFFENGGTHCYVVRAVSEDRIKDDVLTQLEAFDDVAIVAAPGLPSDATKPAAVTDIVTHCANMADRIAVLDAPNVALADLKQYLPGQPSKLCDASDFAALYTPWLWVADPLGPGKVAVPPSGHVAGIYARVDATRGVHKAPANEQVRGTLGPTAQIGRAQQSAVNRLGVNCIRVMQGATKVWGARTLAGETSLHKYVPIRRLLSYLYKSIDHGTQWAVFEPNNGDTWARLVRNVSAFLTGVWAQGALAGDTPAQAFYVKCDAENNRPEDRANGELHIDVGVATVFPAEFVVFRVQQYVGPIK